MTARANADIRNEVKASGVRFWQIADYLGEAESALSRRLRYELDSGEKEKIRAAIREIGGGKNDADKD